MPKRKRIKYWSFYYMPRWEAASKEVQKLVQTFDGPYDTHLNAFSAKAPRLYRNGHVRCLPIPWGLPTIPLLVAAAKRYDINHVFGSQTERLLTPLLAGPRTILTIAKDSGSKEDLARGISTFSKLGKVVVESVYHYELLIEAGLDKKKIQIIYPGVDKRPYVPSDKPFTVFFATSPRGKHGVAERGLPLIIEAAKRLPDVHWLLAWRDDNIDALRELMGDDDLPNVDVRNGHIPDIRKLYESSHAVILPAMNPYSLKPSPHSALESLAHGKPLLVSEPVSMSCIVKEEKCGAVFEPTTDALVAAVEELRGDYDARQKMCHPTVDKYFSTEGFIESYRKLYEEVLGS